MDRRDVKRAAGAGDVATLTEVTRSHDNRLRKAALKALVRLGTHEAADAVASTALTAYDPVVQSDATHALSKFDDMRIVPAERRAAWLRGELDTEPDTTAPAEGSVLAGSSGEGLELVTPPADVAGAVTAGPLAVVGPRRHRAGAAIELILSMPGWPDPKVETVTLTVWYQRASLFQHEVDAQVHTTLVGTAMAHPSLSMGQRTKSVAVADLSVPGTQIGADGRLAARFAIPETGPPSIPGVISWRAQADVHRRRGTDRTHLVDFVVEPAAPGLRPPDRVGASDEWLLRLCEIPGVPYEDRLAAAGGDRHLRLHLDTPLVAPGDEVAGTVSVDPGAPAGRRRSPFVALECWRGSELDRTCHRMIEIRSELDVPSTDSSPVGAIPFRISLPTSAPIRPAACHKCPSVGDIGHSGREASVPPTFHGTDLKTGLDDVRWRVVVSAGGEPTPADPWWTSAEVIVEPPRH